MFCSPAIRAHLLVSLCLLSMNSASTSQVLFYFFFFSYCPFRWDRMATMSWNWLFPFSHVKARLELGIFFSAGQLASDNTIAG